MIQDRKGPIINLDASARSVSRIFLFHQRFFLFQNVYFFSFLFFSKRCGGGKQGPAPAWALISYCVSNNASVVYFFLSSFSLFFFDRRIYESVNIFSLLVSRLQGCPNIEHLHLADSQLARVGSQKHSSIYDFVLRHFVFF